MNDCKVILASFILVYSAQSIFYDAIFEVYYAALLLTTTLVVFICYKLPSKITLIYACMQFILGLMYLYLLAGHHESLMLTILYDSWLNYSLILLSFELTIIVKGVFDAINYILRRLRFSGSLSYIFYKTYQAVKKS